MATSAGDFGEKYYEGVFGHKPVHETSEAVKKQNPPKDGKMGGGYDTPSTFRTGLKHKRM